MTILLMTMMIPNISGQESLDLSYEPEMNFTITFIDFELNSGLDPSTDLPSTFFQSLTYSVNYEILYSNITYTDNFNTYVDEISTTSWTSDINSTALTEQKENFSRKSIFTQKNGVAIDALLLEQYFVDNPISSELPKINHHNIYVLNLSRLDSGENDHWLNITETDPDSLIPRTSWRLEWDYDFGNNYNVRFPYPAFSRDSDISIIDLTAFQWYLEWRAIWNQNVQTHESYYNDLDHLIANETLSEKQQTFDDMTTVWLNDWIKNVYFINIDPITSSDLSVQFLVMFDSSQISLNDISWVINSDHVKEAVSQLYETDLQFIVNYVDLNSDLALAELIESRRVDYQSYNPGKQDPFESWNFYDGLDMWYDLAGSTLNNYFEPISGTHLKGSILLLDNASYVGSTPWTGGLFTGLGGSLKLTILYELQRALFADGSHKSGLSRVIVHEIGHAIGIPHPFTNRFASDFVADTMGYYPHSGNYSQLIVQQYRRNQADEAYDSFQTTMYRLLNELSDASIAEAVESHELAKANHEAKLYDKAKQIWKEAERIAEERAAAEPTLSNTVSPPTSIPEQSNESSDPNISSSSTPTQQAPPTSNNNLLSIYFGIIVFTLVLRINVKRSFNLRKLK